MFLNCHKHIFGHSVLQMANILPQTIFGQALFHIYFILKNGLQQRRPFPFRCGVLQWKSLSSNKKIQTLCYDNKLLHLGTCYDEQKPAANANSETEDH